MMITQQENSTRTDKKIDLERLFGPGQLAPFMQEYFQKRPYILHREDPHFYDGLISLADVEALIFSIKSSAMYQNKQFAIVKGNTSPQATELFNEKGIMPAQVMRYYQQGYTFVLNQLQHEWPAIHSICQTIEKHLSTLTYPLPFGKVDADIFLTPPDAQGFLPHYDDVDVFTLQLEGSKNWHIYNQQARFPLKGLSPLSRELIGDPIHTFCLNPGDMFYMPAGFPHEASTNQGHSMHLSIGLAPYKWKYIISDLTTIDEQARSPLTFELFD